jgi:ribosomal protein S18 acetylase RimI-like enzyme
MAAAAINVRIRKADLAVAEDRTLLIHLLNAYAEDPMGGGESLSETTKATLAEKLHNFPTSHVWFAYCNDGSNEVGCGLCTCFEGFSTFAAKRLMNIHDMGVLPAYRGKGIASRLMAEVEQYCKGKGDFCKVTLEVLSNNHPAKSCYAKYGFAPYELGEDAGHAEFWQKKI